ncbi:hypothetical protein U716_10745 [Rhodobacter capsulatus B6]|nr:hypothetical protein U716_10745 [Rhodobacter capsulatus B6]
MDVIERGRRVPVDAVSHFGKAQDDILGVLGTECRANALSRKPPERFGLGQQAADRVGVESLGMGMVKHRQQSFRRRFRQRHVQHGHLGEVAVNHVTVGRQDQNRRALLQKRGQFRPKTALVRHAIFRCGGARFENLHFRFGVIRADSCQGPQVAPHRF